MTFENRFKQIQLLPDSHLKWLKFANLAMKLVSSSPEQEKVKKELDRLYTLGYDKAE